MAKNFSVLSLMLDAIIFTSNQKSVFSVSEWCRCMKFIVRQNGGHTEPFIRLIVCGVLTFLSSP